MNDEQYLAGYNKALLDAAKACDIVTAKSFELAKQSGDSATENRAEFTKHIMEIVKSSIKTLEPGLLS